MKWPTVPIERRQIRKAALTAALERARDGFLAPFQSIKCASDAAHAGMPDGCSNDGTGCLCACHDGAAPREEENPK